MNHIDRLIVFYFSGTGNSRRIALWLSELALGNNIPCCSYDIATTDISTVQPIDNSATIVLISPVHGFNFPEITLNFIRNLHKGKNRIVLMNTRAGIKLSKFIIPGLTGIAFMLAAAILKSKGYAIAGQIPFDMPSNWISIHPALRSRHIEFILTKNHDKVITHFERLNAGETDFASNKDIVQDILISPVALAYYFIGRYFFAKSYYASDQCIHCDLCIKECPVKAIEKVEGRPYWTFRCENCMRCMNNCPTNAIETTHGLWIIILLLTPVVCSLLYYGILPTSFHHGLAHFILFNFIFLALITLLYRIQQMALKNKICSKIISWMSLTHYKFWGRYKCK